MLHAMALSFRTASRFSWLVKSKGHILKVKIGRNTAIFATQPSYLNLPVRSITGTSISEAKSKPTKWPEEIALKDDTEQKIKWLASGSAMEMKPLQFFEQLCNFPTPQLTRVKERAELLEQLRDKPIAKYLNESKIPIHPINGKVDFRFLQEPFFADDPVIETLRLMVKPKQGQTVTLVGQSGIGKIGAIFAFAQKQYVLYIEANPCKKQNSFSEFYLHGQKIMQIIAQMGTECSSSLATDLMTCLTQLLWLSHALVLKQQCPFVSPVGWIALESDECQDIKDTMNKLGTWFIEDLKANNCNKDWVAQKHREFDECLRELTQDVVFVIDEAHLAQGLFEESLPG